MKNANIDLKTLIPKLRKAGQTLIQHALFIAVMAVLLVYAFVIWQINQLANAEPSDSAETTALAKSTVPKINQDTIQQIQNLEQTNDQITPQPGQGRNNPFQE